MGALASTRQASLEATRAGGCWARARARRPWRSSSWRISPPPGARVGFGPRRSSSRRSRFAWRERMPLLVVLVAAGGVILASAFGDSQDLPLMLWLAVGAGLYSLGEYGSNAQCGDRRRARHGRLHHDRCCRGRSGQRSAWGLASGRRPRGGACGARDGLRVGRARGPYRDARGRAGEAGWRGRGGRACAHRARAARRDRRIRSA